MRAQKGGKNSGETARKIEAKQENEALENQISFPKRNLGKNCECCINNKQTINIYNIIYPWEIWYLKNICLTQKDEYCMILFIS